MTVQFIHYAPDSVVNAAIAAMVNDFGGALTNPQHATVAAILAELERHFGDYARGTKLWIH
jgi:hypothetical protein